MKKDACKIMLCACSLMILFQFIGGPTPILQAMEASFSTAVIVEAGSGARSICFADLDENGAVDMMVANTYDGTVSVHLGDGAGGFGSATNHNLVGPAFPVFVTSADLNKDGNVDAVTANYLTNSVSILIGNGDGTFLTPLDISLTTSSEYNSGPMCVVIGDFNNDGHLDLATANFDVGSISLLFGDGTGSFTPPVLLDTSTGPQSLTAGDINNDGNLDIAVACSTYHLIEIFLGDGAGGFTAQTAVDAGSHLRDLALADFNADGTLDIAVSSYDDDRVYIINGAGDGTFQSVQGYQVGAWPYGVALGDLNGDGSIDVTVTNAGSYTASILLNDVFGTFEVLPALPLGGGELPLCSAVKDLNGDSKPDIATANFNTNNVSILINTTNARPTADAGTDQLIYTIGTLVTLDGSESYDLEGDPIIYSWTIVTKPPLSNASLDDPAAAMPTFSPDVYGYYIVELVVSDPWTSSIPATVTIGFENLPPVADAGDNQVISVGDTAILDGSRSSDPNGDACTYNWVFVSRPAGSSSCIQECENVTATFIPDLPGIYEVELVVADGLLQSASTPLSSVSITATADTNAATYTLEEAVLEINAMESGSFKNRNMGRTLTAKINEVIALIEEGLYQEALDKLEHDILNKLDGCTSGSGPDKNDWIVDCEDQIAIRNYIDSVIDYLAGL